MNLDRINTVNSNLIVIVNSVNSELTINCAFRQKLKVSNIIRKN